MEKIKYDQPTVNIWFPEQIEPVYDPSDFVSTYQFKEYWKREKDRCMNGFDLADGKVHIPGRLYFHTVYAKIATYLTDKNGRKRKDIIVPTLRDIDWDIFSDLEKCTDEGLFYILVGARDFGKSVIAGTCATWQYTFFANSETCISSGDAKFIKVATDKISTQLLYLHPSFRKKRLANDWKNEIRAGWKEKTTGETDPRSSMSVIWVRNYDDGTNTMAANGTRPSFHLIDEIGTITNLIGCVKDSDGCWWSGDSDKPSCLVMLAGTGGDMEVGEEAGEIFYNTEAYNMLSFPNPEAEGTIGRFISSLRARMKQKEAKTLSEYLGVSHPDLDKITILVSNEQRAMDEFWTPKFELAKKSGKAKSMLKFKAYNPLVPSDSFIRLSSNIFDTELSKSQQVRIRTNEIVATPVELFHSGETIEHKFSSKLAITEWPIKENTPTDAPIQIWEFPVKDPPWGLYVCGVDPYRYNDSTGTPSMGSVYIYKRMHNIAGDKYQDMFVASYVARPEKKTYWQEQARWLIKYYNALTLCENDVYDFIDYMIAKGDSQYLQAQPEWIKEFILNSQVKRDYGLNRSEKAGKYLDGQLKTYMEESIYTEKDDKGSTIKEILGVQRVFDYMLLEETIKYDGSKKYKGKFDRVVAAGNAIALANHLNPVMKHINKETDSRYRNYGKQGHVPGNNLFDSGSSRVPTSRYRRSSGGLFIQ